MVSLPYLSVRHVCEWPTKIRMKALSRNVTHGRPQIDLRLTNFLFAVRLQTPGQIFVHILFRGISDFGGVQIYVN